MFLDAKRSLRRGEIKRVDLSALVRGGSAWARGFWDFGIFCYLKESKKKAKRETGRRGWISRSCSIPQLFSQGKSTLGPFTLH